MKSSAIIDLKQGSPEWHAFRQTKIGASDCPIIMGASPWRSAKQLWQEKLGLIDPQPFKECMQRGMDLEPLARALFIEESGLHIKPIVMVHPEYEWMIASLDGYNEEHKILVEIKCPGQKTISQAMRGIIPDHYQLQMQHQFAVSGVLDGYYYCFDGDRGFVVPIKRDDEIIERIIIAEKRFYQAMMNMEPLEEWENER